jgi:peroxiredoxin
MSNDTPPASTSAFTTFWLFRANAKRHDWSESERAAAIASIVEEIESHSDTISLRAAYSTTGYTAGVDLILWLVTQDAAAFGDLGVALHKSPAATALDLIQTYMGTASTSQYDPNHGPAFLRGIPPKRYLSVYPFTKTPAWYLLPFEERRSLMVEHGKMGNEFPTILTNTVSSFGIADQEFVVALEDDNPATLIQMVQRLRAAEVRVYTQIDTPIYLGIRKDLREALSGAL